jgi:hypothetical protein
VLESLVLESAVVGSSAKYHLVAEALVVDSAAADSSAAERSVAHLSAEESRTTRREEVDPKMNCLLSIHHEQCHYLLHQHTTHELLDLGYFSANLVAPRFRQQLPQRRL